MMKKNQTCMYPHPFSANYWKDAAAECRNVRSLTFTALLCALAIVIEKFSIPIAPSVYISMSFLPIALCSMLTGPVLAVFGGFITDVVGAITSGYSFFFGYTLTAILTAVIYALFLYRAKFSFARVLISKAIINFFVNVLLGSLWRVMYYGGAFGYYAALSGVKNLALLPLEVFLICVFFSALRLPLVQLKALPDTAEFAYRKKQVVILTVVMVIGIAMILPYMYYYDEIKAFLQTLFQNIS